MPRGTKWGPAGITGRNVSGLGCGGIDVWSVARVQSHMCVVHNLVIGKVTAAAEPRSEVMIGAKVPILVCVRSSD